MASCPQKLLKQIHNEQLIIIAALKQYNFHSRLALLCSLHPFLFGFLLHTIYYVLCDGLKVHIFSKRIISNFNILPLKG